MFKLWVLYHWFRVKFRRKFKSREQLIAWQEKRLRKFEKNTLSRSPYYRDLMQAGLNHENFPLIGKREFVAQFNEINTLGLDFEEAYEFAAQAEQDREFQSELKGCTIGLSTGTSGNRALFVASPKERALWAAQIFSKVVRPRLFSKQKVAFILRANSNLYESVKSIFFDFSFFDLKLPIQTIKENLNTYNPEILCAQPSMLCMLAAAKYAGELHISPKQIISYAEVLDANDRKYLETCFGEIISEVYQCTEGFLGHTCRYGAMHLNEEVVRIERKYLTKHRFQPIVTDFYRSTQPVVRYLMNDILVEAEEPCPCGSPCLKIDRIEGRMDEVLVFQDEKGESIPIFPDFLRRCIVMADSRVEDYLVVQTKPLELTVFLQIPGIHIDEAMKNILQALKELLQTYDVGACDIIVENGIPERDQIDKKRRIIREFPDVSYQSLVYPNND